MRECSVPEAGMICRVVADALAVTMNLKIFLHYLFQCTENVVGAMVFVMKLILLKKFYCETFKLFLLALSSNYLTVMPSDTDASAFSVRGLLGRASSQAYEWEQA